eukprot:150576-Amphidinium_carterae.1
MYTLQPRKVSYVECWVQKGIRNYIASEPTSHDVPYPLKFRLMPRYSSRKELPQVQSYKEQSNKRKGRWRAHFCELESLLFKNYNKQFVRPFPHKRYISLPTRLLVTFK